MESRCGEEDSNSNPDLVAPEQRSTIPNANNSVVPPPPPPDMYALMSDGDLSNAESRCEEEDSNANLDSVAPEQRSTSPNVKTFIFLSEGDSASAEAGSKEEKCGH